MVLRFVSLILGGFVLVGFSGCGGQQVSSTSGGSSVSSAYVTKSEPAGAIPVGEARSTAKSDDVLVLIGHIGGSAKPFVDGIAAFTVVDPKVPYCAAKEGCPTPWDYCCEQGQVKDNIAMVQIVDDSGKTIAEDARKLLGVKELNLVVVKGKAQRDDAGNLTLLAEKVFLKK